LATYLIDFLAIRAGNEKGDDKADTVGCCSLRVEHVKLMEDYHVNFRFLGKDSIEYNNTVKIAKLSYENLKNFIKNKVSDS
jgi:DNA topoisomerase-1